MAQRHDQRRGVGLCNRRRSAVLPGSSQRCGLRRFVRHKIYALNAVTGTELWNNGINGAVTSPAVVNGTIYIGSNNATIYAFGLLAGSYNPPR